MDDFGVLVKNYGINPRGKSAPMATLKKAPKSQNHMNSNEQDPIFFSETGSNPIQHSNSSNGYFFNDQNDDIFGFNISNNNHGCATNRDVFEDVFTTPTSNSGGQNNGVSGFDFDVESMFKGSVDSSSISNLNVVDDDDSIWGFSGSNGNNVVSGVGGSGDLLSSDPVDDFWGKLGKLGLDNRDVKRLGEAKVGDDDLIPGFETTNNRAKISTSEKSVSVASFEELEKFATANGKSSSVKNEVNTVQPEAPDLESYFNKHIPKIVSPSKVQSVNKKVEKVSDMFPGATVRKEKKNSQRNISDDLCFMFDVAPSSSQFKEIDGESKERRELRWQRHKESQARQAQALEEMHRRDFQAKQEQEQRHRIAETVDVELKRWAAGKEGNLRALLSSLQLILGPEYGWVQVTLTDLITTSQVKTAYKKAALCVHPDKVQQKGAQQKYVAEKIFDLLKEAWNKFNAEEMR